MTWVVDAEFEDPRDADPACAIIFDHMRPRIGRVSLDGYSNYREPLPDAVRAARDWLLEQGRSQGLQDPAWSPDLYPSERREWDMVRAHAAWSIETDIFDQNDQLIAVFHDHGHSITLEVTQDEAAELSLALTGVATLVPLAELRARRDAERSAHRRARRRRLLRTFRT